MNENDSDVETEKELTPTSVVELSEAVHQTSINSSQSSIIRLSTETSGTRNRPLKRKFVDSIDALREIIRDSATAKVSVEQPGDIERATGLFLNEVQKLLPEN